MGHWHLTVLLSLVMGSSPVVAVQLPIYSPPEVTSIPNEIIVKLRETATTTTGSKRINSDRVLKANQIRSTDPWVRFQDRMKIQRVRQLGRGVSQVNRPVRSISSSGAMTTTARSKPIHTGTSSPGLDRIYKLEVELQGNRSIEETLDWLRQDPDVEYAELNYVVTADSVPNDPFYPMQWALNNHGQAFPSQAGGFLTGTPGADISVEEAWDCDNGAGEVIIAVIDTGIDYHHRDLQKRMWQNPAEREGTTGIDDDGNGLIDDIYGYDFVNDDSDPLDEHGHGTHCAGIIGAEIDNGLDIAGICRRVRLMAVQNLDPGGWAGGSFASAEAILYAVDNGADIISCSWGASSHAEVLKETLEYAHNQGVMVVFSAGNENSSERQFPACYDSVIAVAATDANDERMWFSSYGDWVDIAAPGGKILSLRAAGTDLYLNSDDYIPGQRLFPFGDPNATMYVASGTSVAAPTVAGVAGLIWSQWPEAPLQEITDRLLLATDDLSASNPQYVGLLGSGRVNAFRAVSPTFRGVLTLDRDLYRGHDGIQIRLVDFDLVDEPTAEIHLSTDQGDREQVSLSRNNDTPWLFEGSMATETNELQAGDGILQVIDEETIAVLYEDQADEAGDAFTAIATAWTDTRAAEIVEVRVETTGASPRMVVRTDEPTTVRILEIRVKGGSGILEASDLSLTTDHTLTLADVADDTEYRLVVELTDRAGNVVTDNNGGAYYRLNTVVAADVYVPSQYPTIQEGIDNCWPGYTVWVTDGTYTGEGNRDIEFRGKAITVRSENGPENCVIDCRGTETEPHRGFLFHAYEGSDSILSGFTIINGYAPGEPTLAVEGTGDAILCIYAGPRIQDCIIRSNRSSRTNEDNAAIVCFNSTSTLDNLLVVDNDAGLSCNASHITARDCCFVENGLGVLISSGEATLTNCQLNRNEGAGIDSHGTLQMQDCLLSDNHGSGLMCDSWSNTTLRGCLILGNHSTDDAGGIDCRSCAVTATHCRLIGNRSDAEGGAIGCRTSTIELAHCVIAGNHSTDNAGGIDCRSCAVTATHCRLIGNRSDAEGGAIDCRTSTLDSSHCVIADNRGVNGAIHAWQGADMEIRNCTLLNNESLDDNPAIYLSSTNDRLVLVDSIVRNDTVEQIGYRWSLPPENIQISYTNIQGGWEGLGNIDEDPLFIDATSADPNDWDLNLRPGSPCVDGGSPDTRSLSEDDLASVLDGDGDGVAVGDMGAFEYMSLDGAPIIATNRSEAVFSTHSGGTNPAAQELRIYNAGVGVLDFVVQEDPPCDWLSLGRTQGSIVERGQTLPILLNVNAIGLSLGNHRCDLVIEAQQALNSPVIVPVELRISEPVYVPESYPTIQAAIDAAESGGAIIVSPGIYVENINFGGKDLVLSSLDPGDVNVVSSTVIDGDQVESVVTFSGSETPFCQLSGFTITRGYTEGDGGGISGHGTHATIENCAIIDNTVTGDDSGGGGMADCDGIIRSCLIQGNQGLGENSEGAGLFGCDGIIVNCTITDNRAIGDDSQGGGLAACHGTIMDCVIRNNVAEENGGGVYNCSGDILNCVVSNNISLADNGGGLAYVSGAIANCLVAGNRSWLYGGGLDRCTGPIRHCTIVDNVTRFWGGGVARSSGSMTNCIITDNYAGLDGQQFWYSSVPSHSCFPGAADRGNIDLNPSFASPGCWDPNGTPWDYLDDIWIAGDYHLTESSACIDAGSNLTGVVTDLSGVPRPLDGTSDGISTADMGCYEFNPFGRTLPVLEVNTRRFEFVADADGPAPETQSLRMRNWGSGGLSWQVIENCAWLTVTPTQGQAGSEFQEIQLSADHTGLTPGVYSCSLEVRSDDAVNGPYVIEVSLTVTGPEFGLCPRFIEIDASANQSPAQAVLSLRNHGSGSITWQVRNDCPWLSVGRSHGVLLAEQGEMIALQVDLNGMPSGQYRTTLLVSDDIEEGHEHAIPVVLNVVESRP
jgi:subtilisin family serine protease